MATAQSAFDLAQLPPGWRPIPERLPSSLSDSNQSTVQTIARMCGLIKDALSDPVILDLARRVSGSWGRGPGELRCCWDVFWLCKHRVRFLTDEAAVLGMYGETDQVDFLISPSVLMRMKRPVGDCDDFTMLACALLLINKVQPEIVTVAADPSEPSRWSHVYLRAILPDGRRLVLDPTNGQYPGWEVPACDVFQKQIWDMDGRAIADAAPIRESRMRGLDAPSAGVDWLGVVAAVTAVGILAWGMNQ